MPKSPNASRPEAKVVRAVKVVKAAKAVKVERAARAVS
jgi:hypothetical protein